jgi:Ca2+-binding RTX toxin-like protein
VITWTADRITATADAGGDTVTVTTRELGGNTFPAFLTGGPTTYTPATQTEPGCIEDNTFIVCDVTGSFLLQGGGGRDSLSMSDEAALNGLPATLNGGPGNDNVKDFSPGNRTLDGGDGDDVMFGSGGDDTMRGGAGNDEMDGEDGNDTVSGGDGDDALFGDHFKAPGTDVIDGGPGFDRIRDDWSFGTTNPPVDITLDRTANDGRPGENDNVFDVEQIEGPAGRYVGSDAAETFVVGASGLASSVSGGGGNDTITTLNGPDTVDGGAGDDRITAGFDNDTVTGGPGRDALFADTTDSFCGIFVCTLPFGNDTVNARDGEPDQIDCGVGADRAVTDTSDTVANCETNEAAGPSGGGPSGGSGGGPGAAAALTVVSARSIRQIVRRGLKIRVSCPARCTIRARLIADRKLARKLRLGRSRQLAGARRSLASAGSATLTLKVVKKARKRFGRMRRATVTLNVTRTGASALSRQLRLGR